MESVLHNLNDELKVLEDQNKYVGALEVYKQYHGSKKSDPHPYFDP